MVQLSLQERHDPAGICFGCGPKNERGLRIRSYVVGDEVLCTWQPESHHQAFSGCLERRHHRCAVRLPRELDGGARDHDGAR